MLKIDNNLLVQLGLQGLPDSEKNSLLNHIYETLEMRVGMRLADQMTDDQLKEFEQYFEAKDEARAFQWLETNFPNYKDIVQQEFDKLVAEVGQAAPQILAAALQQVGAQTPPVQPAPAQTYQAQPINPMPAEQPQPMNPAAIPPMPPLQQQPVQPPYYPNQQPPAGF